MNTFELRLQVLIELKGMDIERTKKNIREIETDPSLSRLKSEYEGRLKELEYSLEELKMLLVEFKSIAD